MRTRLFSASVAVASMLAITGCGNKTNSSAGDADSLGVDEVAVVELPGVNLGLSVNWAECNVGAESPEETGFIVPIGNTEGTSAPVNTSGNVAGTDKDIATAKLGKGWRMPTTEEWRELIDNCTWTDDEVNGKKGARITAKNGNTIFLPACGRTYQCMSGLNIEIPERYLCDKGYEGNYWSGRPEGYYNFIHFRTEPLEARMMSISHDYCLTVRAVYDKNLE